MLWGFMNKIFFMFCILLLSNILYYLNKICQLILYLVNEFIFLQNRHVKFLILSIQMEIILMKKPPGKIKLWPVNRSNKKPGGFLAFI